MSLYKPVQSPKWTGAEPCQRVPEIFHPDSGDTRDAATAKWICRLCPSQRPCLEWALSDPALLGVHGGTTYRQRRKMRERGIR